MKTRNAELLLGSEPAGGITEWTAGWRVAAALQGPCFLVLADFARNLPLLPEALALFHMGEH